MLENYLRFWGVRGSYPAPYATHMKYGGNTPCVELRLGEHVMLFDAGTGSIAFGGEFVRQRTAPPNGRAPASPPALHMFLTHYHWDHISGLPFFVPAFTPDLTINIYAPAETREEVKRLLDAQMKAPYFPVETETWLADINYEASNGHSFEVGPATISSFGVHHPGLTLGYRVEVGGRVIIFAPDNEVFFMEQSIETQKDRFDEDERTLLDIMKAEQRMRVIEFMEGADVLIHDAQYTQDDYQKKRGWGHSCYIDTVNAAIDASVKSLYLFSYDPNYDDAALDQLYAHTREIINERQATTQCIEAREGLVVPLDLS